MSNGPKGKRIVSIRWPNGFSVSRIANTKDESTPVGCIEQPDFIIRDGRLSKRVRKRPFTIQGQPTQLGRKIVKKDAFKRDTVSFGTAQLQCFA